MSRRSVARMLELAGPLATLVLWWLATAHVVPRAFPNLTFFFPTPIEIGKSFREQFFGSGFTDAVAPTLERYVIGYSLAAVLGIGLGVCFGVNRIARLAAMPFVTFFRALPGVVLIPIITLFLGLGDAQKITTVVVASVWPILINTMDGVRSLDLTIRDSAAAYGVRGIDRYRFVVVPAAMPQVFVGLRIATAVSLIVTVVVELYGANTGGGIGFFLTRAQGTFDMPALWAGIILLGLLASFFNVCFFFVESKMLAWHRGSRANALA